MPRINCPRTCITSANHNLHHTRTLAFTENLQKNTSCPLHYTNNRGKQKVQIILPYNVKKGNRLLSKMKKHLTNRYPQKCKQ